MPPRIIPESHRPRVSDRTMRCHSPSGQPPSLLVSRFRLASSQTGKCNHRGKRSVLSFLVKQRTERHAKNTQRSRPTQSNGAECREKTRHRAQGEILTFPFIGLLRANSCARQLRGFCFSASSRTIQVSFGKRFSRSEASPAVFVPRSIPFLSQNFRQIP